MYIFLSIVYVLVCLFLILVVLLQQGKGGGMGSAFGGGGSQTVFGGAGATNVLTRATTASAPANSALSWNPLKPATAPIRTAMTPIDVAQKRQMLAAS